MTDIGFSRPRWSWRTMLEQLQQWRLAKIASPDFQNWAAGFRLTRPFVRQDSAALFDLMAGFVYTQTLLACVELDILEALRNRARSVGDLANHADLPVQRMEVLCQSAAAVGLLLRKRDGTYRLGRLGAAALGVPGLAVMIRHHQVFYRDLADPVALLKGEIEPELSKFWAYVRGDHAAEDREIAADYSHIMATSQQLVARETLDAVDLSGISTLTDIGGGTGAFLQSVAERHPHLSLRLFDLPAVIDAARVRLAPDTRINLHPGSFLSDPLPEGSDAVTLIRVLYDHQDHTVRTLLSRIHDSLPVNGRIVISEPMSGGRQPCRVGDSYFGFYTTAMTTGCARSAERHIELLTEAGFSNARQIPTNQPLLTSVVIARKGG
ncbi:MAG: methyltransferase [Pseudomonadota bacterium]